MYQMHEVGSASLLLSSKFNHCAHFLASILTVREPYPILTYLLYELLNSHTDLGMNLLQMNRTKVKT